MTMKLIVTIVHNEDARALANHLAKAGFQPTLINSTETYLYGSRALVLIHAEPHQVETATNIIRKTCKQRERFDTPLPPPTETGEMFISTPIKREIGGATVFVLDAEQFYRF